MNARSFFYLVASMRSAQKAYISNKSGNVLRAAIKYERMVDTEIDRVITIERHLQRCETCAWRDGCPNHGKPDDCKGYEREESAEERLVDLTIDHHMQRCATCTWRDGCPNHGKPDDCKDYERGASGEDKTDAPR